MSKLTHEYDEYDEDAGCIHCGFDGPETYHLRRLIPKYERCPPEDWEVYCEKRKNVLPTPGLEYDNG